MKKVLTFLLVLVAGLVLIACDETQENLAPELHGVEAVEIMVGDEFDPLEGVTATDDKDEDLEIVVEGTVNVNKAGEYELTYKVTDSAGLTTMKRRVVTVKGLGGLVNGDFSDGFNGWVTWFDGSKSYDVEYLVEEGKAVIDVKEVDENDNQWWGIQLQFNGLELTQFESYTLKFTVSAENERYMNYQIQGGGIPAPGKAFGEKNLLTISETPQTIEKDFFVKGDATGAQLQFAFGNFTKETYGPEIDETKGKVAGKIFISDVQIVAGPELENQAPELTAPNVFLEVGTEDFLIMQGVTVSDDRDILTLVDVSFEDITEDGEFTLPAVEGVYEIEYSVTDSEGLETKVVRVITVTTPWQGEQDLTVTAYGSWGTEASATGWFVRDVDQTEETGRIKVTQAEGVTSIELLEIADADYMTMLGVSKLQLFPGKYTVTFDIKADDARLLRIAVEGAGLTNAFTDQAVTTDWTTVTIVYEVATFQSNKIFQFMFGSLTTDRPGVGPNDASTNILTTFHIRNFEVNFEK